MGFRWRFFIGLIVAVLLGTVIDAVQDYVEARRDFNTQIEHSLDRLEHFAKAAISLESGTPRLPGINRSTLPESRYQVTKEGQVIFAVADTSGSDTWVSRERALADGYILVLEVDAGTRRAALNRELRIDLTNDMMQVLVSVAVAWLLSGFFLRPLRAITRAIKDMSQQPSGELKPVPVPPGNDQISQLAVSFNRMADNIQTAFERERVFTRYVSHELRTPVSAMKLQLESLELGLSPVEKVVPTLERNLGRMQRVLEALLSLARSADQNHEPVALTRLVHEALQLFPEEVRKRVVVRSQLRSDSKVDNPYLVGQCILNLIDNAVKYTPEQIDVALGQRGARLLVCVQDRGGGVPEAQLDKLTHTFFRLSKSGEGSGLGLSFVKHVVSTLGGEVTLKNTGEGLEVTLELPRAGSHEASYRSLPLKSYKTDTRKTVREDISQV